MHCHHLNYCLDCSHAVITVLTLHLLPSLLSCTVVTSLTAFTDALLSFHLSCTVVTSPTAFIALKHLSLNLWPSCLHCSHALLSLHLPTSLLSCTTFTTLVHRCNFICCFHCSYALFSLHLLPFIALMSYHHLCLSLLSCNSVPENYSQPIIIP